MKHLVCIALAMLSGLALAQAQETASPTPTPRSLFGRMLHPFGGGNPKKPLPNYKNPKLQGLDMAVEVSPEPVKLSEVRQLGVDVALMNRGNQAVELSFPSDQRIDIHLLNPLGNILARWSENRTFADKPMLILLNPQERLEYHETMPTRELTPNKVFTVEAYFPQYPELKAQKKFMAVP